MNCKNHTENEAGFACNSCGQPLCLECTVELNNKAYCKDCLAKHIQLRPVQQKYVGQTRKSKFLTFFLGMLPGTGHMYLGLVNKGLSMMILFFGGIFITALVSGFFRSHWIPQYLIPVLCVTFVAYSIFDALAATNDINSGKTVTDYDSVRINLGAKVLYDKVYYKHNAIGYALIILGSIGLLKIFMDSMNGFLRMLFGNRLPFTFSGLFVPILLVIGGVYLLRKGNGIKM